MQQKFNVVIERDSEGWLVASVPSLHGCHSQARSFDELDLRIKEAISLCLEDEPEFIPSEFVGIQQISVEV
jgi:predicted RNase H-like HicB family nuclease